MRLRSPTQKHARKGAATVEFALLIPLLMFLVGIGVDWARAFYYHLTITNAARNAAIYGSGSPARSTDTAGIEAMARRDTTSLGDGVSVSSTVVTVNSIDYLKVTVSYAFSPVSGLPGTPSSQTIFQTSEMRVLPTAPRAGTY